LQDLIKDLDHNSESFSKIVCFARESEENRKFLARMDGFIVTLVEFLGNAGDGKCSSFDFLEQVVEVLDLVLSKVEGLEQVANSMLKTERNCLASLLLVLQQGSIESRIASARVLGAIANDGESKLLIADKDGLLS